MPPTPPKTLAPLGRRVEKNIVSAHRTQDGCSLWKGQPRPPSVKIIIAGAGGGTLPGMTAVADGTSGIRRPIESTAVAGVDSLYSIVFQMPRRRPVGNCTRHSPAQSMPHARGKRARALNLKDPVLSENSPPAASTGRGIGDAPEERRVARGPRHR